jgi:hypothetical protein
MRKISKKSNISLVLAALSLTLVVFLGLSWRGLQAQPLQEDGAVGVEGTVPGNPPTSAPTISVPKTGQAFNSLPITVSGLCQTGLLVEVFKNNVFAGSVTCVGSSYSVQIDLFSGQNNLIARQYDALNQASPDSNTVIVTFNDGSGLTGSRVSLTTAFAKRGALPGSTLTWPLTLSGGQGPYALSIDWGDKSQLDLISRSIPGDFEIEHIYKQAGVYNITIRATDANGFIAFLQVVGIGNGPIEQSSDDGQATIIVEDKSLPLVFWVIVGMVIPILIIAFWLGRKHQLQHIRDRLRRGERPF